MNNTQLSKRIWNLKENTAQHQMEHYKNMQIVTAWSNIL